MVTTSILIGETLTGRITDTLDAGDVTSGRWTDPLNEAGSIEQVTVPEAVVRDLKLRERTYGSRTFMAFERDNRIKQAGPIRSRRFNWETGALTLGASGIWSYLDQLVVRPVGAAPPYQTQTFTVTGKSLGGLCRALVERAITELYTNVPIVLPADEAGDHTESFPVWKVLRCGEQLKQVTQRAVDAPDLRFAPRRKASDVRYLEWLMQVGTDARPTLSQVGDDWIFDATASQSPVKGISTEEDSSNIAQQVWLTGNGMEQNILMSVRNDPTLNQAAWPLTEADESRSTVEDQATLDGHAENLLARSSRPIEVFRVAVDAAAANEVLGGDYARLVTKGDVWLGDMNRRMRVRQVAGDLSDTATLDMFPLQAAV